MKLDGEGRWRKPVCRFAVGLYIVTKIEVSFLRNLKSKTCNPKTVEYIENRKWENVCSFWVCDIWVFLVISYSMDTGNWTPSLWVSSKTGCSMTLCYAKHQLNWRASQTKIVLTFDRYSNFPKWYSQNMTTVREVRLRATVEMEIIKIIPFFYSQCCVWEACHLLTNSYDVTFLKGSLSNVSPLSPTAHNRIHRPFKIVLLLHIWWTFFPSLWKVPFLVL